MGRRAGLYRCGKSCLHLDSIPGPSIFYLGTRSGWVVNVTPWPHFTPWKEPISIVHEAEWAAGPV